VSKEGSYSTPTLLVTAGPTHEPIDEVRYIGNRSSGRLGMAIVSAAKARGWRVILLLGPVPDVPEDTGVQAIRFRTCADLQVLLDRHAPDADIVIMAAAVADFRPAPTAGKIRRSEGPLSLQLEATPDLLAALARRRRPGQILVGFALEPRDQMLTSARQKLIRKKADLIVANTLETMDSETIEAVALDAAGGRYSPGDVVSKERFAGWLLDLVGESWKVRLSEEKGASPPSIHDSTQGRSGPS
jgi:phosphopantothenoylcysteine decarboxylase/phosphopantothenate--cysteine ligase